MATKKKSKSLVTTDYYKSSGSGLGSYPLAVQPNESLENTFMVPKMTPLGDASGAMKYQDIGSAYIGNGMNDAFMDAGFDPYAKKSLIKPSVVAQISENATMVPDTHDYGNGGQEGNPLSTSAAPVNSGWGFMDASSNDAKNEALYRIGENWGNLSEADQAAAAGKLTGLDTKSLVGSDITKTGNGSGGQWVNGLSNFEALQGVAGLGNLGMSLYGMFGENGTNAVNKKNMQLMDQQIANNKDIMKTRTERAGDIKKYFG